MFDVIFKTPALMREYRLFLNSKIEYPKLLVPGSIPKIFILIH